MSIESEKVHKVENPQSVKGDGEETHESYELDEQSKRVRMMSEKGRDYYLSQYEQRTSRVDKSWVIIESMLVELDGGPKDLKTLRQMKSDLGNAKKDFLESTKELLEFLSRVGTSESADEMVRQRDRLDRRMQVAKQLHQRIEDVLMDAAETLSQGGQSADSVTSSLTKKRMVAEKERAKLAFMQQQVDLMQEKVKIEGRMQVLEQRKNAAIAEAEVRVLEQISDSTSDRASLNLGEVDKAQQVEDYVNSHSSDDRQQPAETDLVNTDFPPADAAITDPASAHQAPISSPIPPQTVEQGHMAAISNFLLKKELLISRFISFTDEPDTYIAWKANFTSIVKELNVSNFEEIQLLVRWLGPESGKFAANIRQATVNSPSDGVRMIWERLDERYGAVELVDSSLKMKLAKFPPLTLKDSKRLYDLLDLLTQIESMKGNPVYAPLLSYFDTSVGILPIVNKLPYQWREKWTTKAYDYKQRISVPYPPFSYFVKFMQDLSKVRNDPGFQYEERPIQRGTNRDLGGRRVTVMKSHLPQVAMCPIHKLPHTLKDCKIFRSKDVKEKKKLLKDHRICYRCCTSDKHMARDCTASVYCTICKSKAHLTMLHPDSKKELQTTETHGGEEERTFPKTIESKCTQICGSPYKGKSCAKTLLVRVYPEGKPEQAVRMYAIVDDQSNRSLVKSEFFQLMGLGDSCPQDYVLTSCAGSVRVSGRRAAGFVVESLDGSERMELPTLVECNDIPSVRDEIPTPEVARSHSHLVDVAPLIPSMDPKAKILLLLGRDLVEAHYVMDQRIGHHSPFAQRLRLGWVLIGESCLSKVHAPDEVRVNKTHLLVSGRPSIMTPCTNYFCVKEPSDSNNSCDGKSADRLFERTRWDDKPGLSIEDRQFLSIMDEKAHKGREGRWVAPLPFRTQRRRLPDNRPQAMKRALALTQSLQRNPQKQENFLEFMQGILDNNYAEEAPPLTEEEERWYLPIFGIYHPKKPTKLRVVFDSSAKFDGVSLNDVLLCGPDLTNELLGVLIRFRKDAVAITADIEQMFFRFIVREEDRNFLRFLWHRQNDPTQELLEYRMCVHVFGNSPSPAVATYCLRRSVTEADEDVQYFVRNNFYVDDGLVSVSSPQEGVDLLKRTTVVLKESGLRLHKFSSNSKEVVAAFPMEDISVDLRDVDLCMDQLPVQRSQGLSWNLHLDSFTFNVQLEDKPFTKRGILSTLHSIYDPLGFASPAILQGRLLFREITDLSNSWDDPLPDTFVQRWQLWKQDAMNLSSLEIPRTYLTFSFREAVRRDIHIFSDASEVAVACVAFIKALDSDGKEDVGFLFGKAKVAPKHGHTIPRLELCAAVLGAEMSEVLLEHIDVPIDSVTFHTDSRVVLGYIYNRTRRFYTYVTNRVSRILRVSRPEQWMYVTSQDNPADIGTRGVSARDLQLSAWLIPPAAVLSCHQESSDVPHDLVNAANDAEVRPEVLSLKSDFASVDARPSLMSVFERFSSWTGLISALTFLHLVVLRRKSGVSKNKSVADIKVAQDFVIKTVQKELFTEEYDALLERKSIPGGSSLSGLNPMVDETGLLRVGGRVSKADISRSEKHPVIIPKKSHIAVLIVRHYHGKIHHQGRHLTEGSIRAAGYWIVGVKRLVASEIHKCVTCRRLRGKMETQIMSDLPEDRLKPSPPFTFVGVDAFGPWSVVTRKTRGGSANSKRWAMLFSCLCTRAIHVEVVEEMSTSSFLNAVRRFVSIRGSVVEFRSDRGTNFVGATDTSKGDAINVDDKMVRSFLLDEGTTWVFNPPHSSHFGGAWERMIGVVRRVLEAMILEAPLKNLTHEVLVTFLAEVCAIVNSRPIVPVSSDPDNPTILTPSVLLTHKVSGDVMKVDQFDVNDLYRSQWKFVQILADSFWKRWRCEYLQTLQVWRKWKNEKENVKSGDVVLLREKGSHRCEWPTGVVENAIQSEDGRVRKVTLRVIRNGQPALYTRPISEIVLLFSP